MFGFNCSSKNKTIHSTTQINSSNRTKIIRHIPNVSQIVPLPANNSYGILPILSVDRRVLSNQI